MSYRGLTAVSRNTKKDWTPWSSQGGGLSDSLEMLLKIIFYRI